MKIKTIAPYTESLVTSKRVIYLNQKTSPLEGKENLKSLDPIINVFIKDLQDIDKDLRSLL
jgi:hypothetical protein